MYDFDKTLAEQDMQNYTFIPNLGMTSEEFWTKVQAFRKKNYMESILGYMYYSMIACREKGIPFTKEYLYSTGKGIKFYKGVQNWFDRINQYGESIGAANKPIAKGEYVHVHNMDALRGRGDL